MEHSDLQWILKAVHLLCHIMHPQVAREGDIAVKKQWPSLGRWDFASH